MDSIFGLIFFKFNFIIIVLDDMISTFYNYKTILFLTETLKSIMVEPRSISERIVHKLSSNVHKRKQQNTSSNGPRPNPYVELESAYVAQICITWEALSWNYKSFERKRSSTQRISFNDIGCPAGIADQFRTFHILLQRYVENEPYENGRRPEIYARMRTLAPKLLLVPEYHGT